MGEEKRIQEPVVDSLSGAAAAIPEPTQPGDELSIFRLSGGILRPAAKTSNRIDGLLGKMLVHPESGKYLSDIDKNLDFLITSLQLDMINMAAEEPPASERISSEVQPEPQQSLQLGKPFHDDSR